MRSGGSKPSQSLQKVSQRPSSKDTTRPRSAWLKRIRGHDLGLATRRCIGPLLLDLFGTHAIPQAATSCWGWTGAANPLGYCRLYWPRAGGKAKAIYAHRAAYVLYRGLIPKAFTIDHLCRNRSCVNPAHLEAVPRGTNVLRGEGPVAQNARKTHCIHGHPFDTENTYRHQGKRHCATCRKHIRDRWNLQVKLERQGRR